MSETNIAFNIGIIIIYFVRIMWFIYLFVIMFTEELTKLEIFIVISLFLLVRGKNND